VRMTVKMPKVADSADEVTVVNWVKSIGDTVQAGDPLVEVETDKANVSVPSPIAGVLIEMLVDVDTDVRTGTPIAVLDGS
jgi:pyruvate/2-oxoglutarate dehydrogenase complex dihydrolipoamide acyltransferase (E2) component